MVVRPIGRYQQPGYDPPGWATRPTVWELTAEIFHGPILDGDVGFGHRDFYPGNLLWSGRHLSGVVDWQAACLRPSSIDPGHSRLNMLYNEASLADKLRRAWEKRSGRQFEPWADVIKGHAGVEVGDGDRDRVHVLEERCHEPSLSSEPLVASAAPHF